MSAELNIIELVESSGNSFHARVVKAFRDAGWHTRVSPYYLDESTNRAREIDLVAEKSWLVQGLRGQSQWQLHTKLFVECKYLTGQTAVWIDERDSAAAERWLGSNTPLPGASNIYTQKHHYLASGSQVAKLFASTPGGGQEREALYKALNQALHAMVYLRRSGSIIPPEKLGHLRNRFVELPVILVNSFDGFYSVSMDQPAEPKLVDQNFQLEVHYAFLDASRKRQSEYFLVDVVAYDRLREFFDALERDAEAMLHFG